MPIQMYCL